MGGTLLPGGVVPALNGMPGAAAMGYYPGGEPVPGMAGSAVPGMGMGMGMGMGVAARRPQPTEPPPRPANPPPVDPVAVAALEKITALLERQMDRLDKKEEEQRRVLSKSFKQNVKLSGDLYKLAGESRHRVDRVAALEEDLRALSRETQGEIRAMKKAEKRPLFGWDAARDHERSAAAVARGASGGAAFSGAALNASYLTELERKIDFLAAAALDGSGGGGGGGGGVGGDGLHHSGGLGSSKALRAAQAEVDRLRAETAALRSGKRSAESTLEQLQLEVKNQRPAGEERTAGAFAVLANTDPFSVKAALAVCHMLVHHRTKYDALVITPTRMEQGLADSVRRGGCHPTTLGLVSGTTVSVSYLKIKMK